MPKITLLLCVLTIFCSSAFCQEQDIFNYSPVYGYTDKELRYDNIEFITHGDQNLKELAKTAGKASPIKALDELMAASSNTVINRISTGDYNEVSVEDQALKTKSDYYASGLVEVIVRSQIFVQEDDRRFAYLSYTINFKDGLPDTTPDNRSASGLQVVVFENDQWKFTNESPLGGKFKFALFNAPAEVAIGLITGKLSVDEQSVTSEEGVLDLPRLIQGLEDESLAYEDYTATSDTIILSYPKERQTTESKDLWVEQAGSHPVNPDSPVNTYKKEQLDLFLATHKAMLAYVADPKHAPLTVTKSELYLEEEAICKTHLIKYGYWSAEENTYIFRVERNGPYKLVSFPVVVKVSGDVFEISYESDKPLFSYIDHITGSVHATLLYKSSNKKSSNELLKQLKEKCIDYVRNYSVIDFGCVSQTISAATGEERSALKNTF